MTPSGKYTLSCSRTCPQLCICVRSRSLRYGKLTRMLHLALNDIEHRRTKVKSPKINGFIERFNKTCAGRVLLHCIFRENESTEALQEDLDRWLVHYNTERPHRGYRNRGKRPLDTVLKYAPPVRHEAWLYT